MSSEEQSGISSNASGGIRSTGISRKVLPKVEEFVKGILSGNRAMLARAITLVESARPDHKELAEKIIDACLPHSGKSIRIGITGIPGVGKSTFIESFGMYTISQEKN